MTFTYTKPDDLRVTARGESGQYEIGNSRHGLLENFDRDYVAVSGFFGPFNPHTFAAAPKLLEALEGIKWRSDDKDNMEFAARITYSQMDRILAAIAKAKGGEA